MEVLELEQYVIDTYPDLTWKERMLFMDGWMEGKLDGMLEEREIMRKKLEVKDGHNKKDT